MYEQYYGLNEPPFELTANPRYLFLTARHREALTNVRYGIAGRKGITLLIGEAGTGKTTLLRAALDAHRAQGTLAAYLNNPTLSRQEFYEFLAHEFGLTAGARQSKTEFLFELTRMLRERFDAGTITALVIDEAQSLPDELLEEVRLLANIETPAAKLLPVVLVGQPELAERLNHPRLRQLKQRLALRCLLEPLGLRETAAYISKRIRIAGGEAARIFTREAVEAIYQHSRGVPRTINVVCDNALVSGFALDRKPVDLDIIEEVCREFELPSDEQSYGEPAASAGPGMEAGSYEPQQPEPSPEPSSARERRYFGIFTERQRFSFFQ